MKFLKFLKIEVKIVLEWETIPLEKNGTHTIVNNFFNNKLRWTKMRCEVIQKNDLTQTPPYLNILSPTIL